MRSKIFVLLLIVLFSGFVLAQGDITGGDVEKIEELQDKYSPLDDSGDVDFSKYKPFESSAEKRIAQINEYVGPITKVLWGVELTLSWVFVFSFVMWILMIELIVVPVSGIFEFKVWMSLLVGAIVATLAMQGIGKDLVVWMESLMTQWWVGFVALGGFFVFGFFYWVFMSAIGNKINKEGELSEKERIERDRMSMHAAGELARKSLKG